MDMDFDIKSGVYKNNKITEKVSKLLKIKKSYDKSQLIYISKTLPSGHWELNIKTKTHKNKLNILIKPFKNDGIAASVLSKGLFFIEYSKNCIINFKEDNSNLKIKRK